jgi:hypothetical protein
VSKLRVPQRTVNQSQGLSLAALPGINAGPFMTATSAPPVTSKHPLAGIKELRREIDGGKGQRELSTALNRVVSSYNDLVRNHNMMSRYQ